MDNLNDYDVINPPPKEVPLETVDGLCTVDYTSYDPLETSEVPGVSTIPDQLQVLKLFSNYLTEIPDSFCKLAFLQRLVLCCNSGKPGNGLSSLPSSFGQLKQLQLLHLVGNQFQTFPVPICNLSSLRTLYMNNCKLRNIPEEICKMTSLVEVDFGDNDFSQRGSLPKGLFSLPRLTDLYLTSCGLQELPPEIGNMTNLLGIRLGENELVEFPDEFYKLGKLKKLYAEKNRLASLSPKISQLQSLQFLLLMENKLTTLPNEITKLKELVHLNLFDNCLTCIPKSITEMESLQVLQLEGNNYLQRPPLDVCLGGLERIKGYFESFAAPNVEPIHSKRLKIVLLGESEAGKSSLAHALLHASAKESSTVDHTVGVEIYPWKPTPDGIEFQIIDCAGQRRYQLTHPFFLSEGMC